MEGKISNNSLLFSLASGRTIQPVPSALTERYGRMPSNFYFLEREKYIIILAVIPHRDIFAYS